VAENDSKTYKLIFVFKIFPVHYVIYANLMLLCQFLLIHSIGNKKYLSPFTNQSFAMKTKLYPSNETILT